MDKKWFKMIFCSIVAAIALAACGQKEEKTKEIAIGIVQYAEHEALTSAREGFLEALAESGYKEGESIKIHFQNAQGDAANLQTMVEQVAGKHDLNFAIATPAAQALLLADPETPSIFTAVTDPVTAELVDSLESPGGNMTGSIDAINVSEQIRLLLKVVPEAQTVGIFYNSNEVNSEIQAKRAKEALEKREIAVVIRTVTSTNDVQQAMTSLADQVDAIYLPTDNTVASTAPTIGEILMEKKVPAIGSDEAYLDAVLFTSGVDYRAIGKQAGQLAVEILKGKKPGELAVKTPERTHVSVNKQMAEQLGIDVTTITEE